MTDRQPPLPPFDEDGYLITEPSISFTLQRSVNSSANEIYRAWTDPELFKRWIVPPGHELVSLSVENSGFGEPCGETVWRTKGGTDEEPVMYVMDPQTLDENRFLEIRFSSSAVPGMIDEQSVCLHLGLDERQTEGKRPWTLYKLKIICDSATIWRYISRADLHAFWLEATERLTRFVEQSSTLRKSAA